MIKTLMILLSVSGPIQEPDTTLSAQEAVAIALEKNFDIRLERHNLDITQNNNTLGNAGFLPTVEVNGGTTRSTQNSNLVFASGDEQNRTGAKSSGYNAGITLDWTLFDGLRMFATKERLEQLESSNQFLFKSQVQNVVSDVLKAFYSAALEQERLQLLKNTLELSEERVDISKSKYEVGRASKLEYLQAQVDYNTDQSAYVKQRETLALSRYQLQQMLGIAEVNDSLKLEFEYQMELAISQDEALELAIRQNPNLRYFQGQQEVSLLATKELERAQWPSLDFNLGYNYNRSESEAGFVQSNQANGLNYGLTLSMTVFDGFNQRRNIENAKIQSEYALTNYQKAKNQLLTSVRSAYMTYQNAMMLAELETQNMDVAEENIQIALERYRVGKSNPLEVREAQNNAVNAGIRKLEADNTAKVAEIELMRLTGELLGN